MCHHNGLILEGWKTGLVFSALAPGDSTVFPVLLSHVFLGWQPNYSSRIMESVRLRCAFPQSSYLLWKIKPIFTSWRCLLACQAAPSQGGRHSDSSWNVRGPEVSPFKTSWPFYQGQALLSVWEREDGKRGQVLTSWQASLSLPPSASLNVVSGFWLCGPGQDWLSLMGVGGVAAACLISLAEFQNIWGAAARELMSRTRMHNV